MRTAWDAIVVGLGAIGSGAACWLSRHLGAGVLGHQRLAREHGATLLEHTPVARLRDAGGGLVEVETADGTRHRAPRVVVVADAWTNDLLAAFGRRLPLTVIQAGDLLRRPGC